MIQLANRLAALWNYQRVLRERNTLLMEQEYLTEFFRRGGDSAVVATLYGAPANAPLEAVLKSMAKTMGFGHFDYSIRRAAPAIRWLQNSINVAAKQCMDGGCAGLNKISIAPAVTADLDNTTPQQVDLPAATASTVLNNAGVNRKTRQDDLRSRHAAEWGSFRGKYQKELDAIKAKHEAEWEAFRADYRDELNGIQARHAAEVNNLLTSAVPQQDVLRAKHVAESDTFRSKQQKQEDAIRSKHATEWDRFQAKRQIEEDAIRGKHAGEWDRLRAEQ